MSEVQSAHSSAPSSANDRLCRVQDPLDWSGEKSALMIEACRDMAEFHVRSCSEIAALYKKHGFDPASIRSESEIARIPMLGVSAMKRYLITSLPHERAVLKLTSSGTRGQKTQIWIDEPSLDRVQAMLEVLWEQEGLVSRELNNYLMFVYDPEEAKDLGIAFSDKNQQRFAPVADSFYCIRKNSKGAWEFQREAAVEKLIQYEKEGKPVRLFGIPSFLHDFLSSLKQPFRLDPGSLVMTGGGWKAAEDKQVTREAFRALISEKTGIPDHRIRDGYGMAEHCAPYIDCAWHRFHVPVYNRVIPRDPVSLAPQPPGEAGLLELVTPFNAMMPNLAILTTDMGKIDEEKCPCGHNSPTFQLLGRGGISKHKGCAIAASEIVRR